MKKKDILTTREHIVVNLFIVMMIMLVAFVSKNEPEIAKECLGFISITFSVFTMIYYRKCGTLMFLIMTLSIINICWTWSVCFMSIEYALYWQVSLVNMEENIIAIRSFILFYIFMIWGIGNRNKYINQSKQVLNLNNQFSQIVVVGCFCMLILALLTGYDRKAASMTTGYISNSTPLYEYAIIFFVVAWGFSGKKVKAVLIFYAIVYCLQALIYGDRSSCFPMIIGCFMLIYKKKIKAIPLLLGCMFGIFFGNVIDVLRNGNELFNISTINEVIERGVHVNTFSYSHYAGVQIIRLKNSVGNASVSHFLSYILCIILGGTSDYNLAILAREAGYFNRGGGMTANYFYFWGNYLGVMLGGCSIGCIIKMIYKKNDVFCNFLKLTILIYAIRWYVYYPITFIRTAIVIPSAILFAIKLWKKINSKK